MYEVTDIAGTIHSGPQEEMTTAFNCMLNPDEYDEKTQKQYCTDWDGELRLIQVIAVG